MGDKLNVPDEFVELLRNPSITIIIYERFAAETISKYGLYTVKLCGVIEGIAKYRQQIGHPIILVPHVPSDRRPFLDDAKALLRGKQVTIHERDAVAHILRYEHDIKTGGIL